MSSAPRPGDGVKLHETFTVTEPRSGLTLATTKSGPIEKSGCGRDARKTWADASTGVATIRSMASPSPRLIAHVSSQSSALLVQDLLHDHRVEIVDELRAIDVTVVLHQLPDSGRARGEHDQRGPD